MYKKLTITSLLGFLAIILGAFGSHALKNKLSIEAINSFNTAVQYQMYHTVVLLFVNTYEGFTKNQKNRISLFFFLGIFLFSGSIYVIHLTDITAKSIWFLTPLGGVSFVVGWFLMMLIFLKKLRESKS
ncbi:MAG: Uncharacterised protein [Polaribacter sejongensis]|nr:MAG: Uncharacterised protein [Polaribacter sejongensis]